MIRTMTIDDYDEVYALWKKIRGFGIRSIDDSREGVERFLKRNPTTSVVAVKDEKIVGSILCACGAMFLADNKMLLAPITVYLVLQLAGRLIFMVFLYRSQGALQRH